MNEINRHESNYRDIFDYNPAALWEEDYSIIKHELDKLRTKGITDIESYMEEHPELVYSFVSMVKITNVNKRAVQMYEADSVEELSDLGKIFSEGSYINFTKRLKLIFEGGKSVSYEDMNYTVKGRKLNVLVSMIVMESIIEDYDKVLITDTDISSRINSEQGFLAEKNYWKKLLDYAPFAIWKTDSSSKTVWLNKTWYNFTGENHEKNDRHAWKKYMHPDDIEKYDRLCIEAAENMSSLVSEHRVKNSQGDYIWIIEFAEPIILADGTFDGYIGFCVDINARKNLEESEKVANELLQNLYELAMDLSRTLDLERIFDIIYGFIAKVMPCTAIFISEYDDENKMIKCSSGWKEGKVIDVSAFPILPLQEEGGGTQSKVIKSGRAMLFQDYEKARETSKNKYYVSQDGKIRNDVPPESKVTKCALIVPLKVNNKVKGVMQIMSQEAGAFSEDDMVIAESISHNIIMAIRNAQLYKQALEESRKREALQNEMIQLQKMEAIGRLAGGIAHDFNNILTVIKGLCEIILMDINKNDRFFNEITSISDASDRAAAMTQKLLAFSRKQVLTMENINLNELIGNLTPILSRIIGEDIKLVSDLANDLKHINADQSHIEQIIMNIVINSRDAMPDGGRLDIVTQNISISKQAASENPDIPEAGPYVMLSVKDSGAGIPAGIMDKIFDPFFTTKDKDKGTGLGLATVYGIVKQHKGWIEIESVENQRTEIKVFLPTSSLLTKKAIDKSINPGEYAGSGEVILLVEDEEQILSLLNNILTDNGYTVLPAKNARDAYDIFKREKDRIALVFSDVVLPDRTGVKLIKNMLEMKSDLKILMSSGYADKKSEIDYIMSQGIQFLPKPYKLKELIKRVYNVINM